MNRIGHDLLKYLLIIPLLASVLLGILVDGAFKYAMIENHDKTALEIELITMSLKQLSQQEI